MLVEVIGTSVYDAKTAEAGGAGRIELVSGMLEGGLTPSIGLIRRVVQAVSIPVHVMVRPHSRSFLYDEEDMQVMLADIQQIKQTGAAGIVLGALTSDKQIDQDVLARCLAEAGGLSVTFHRAFDEVSDQFEAVNVLQAYPQIKRILTSGGQAKATDAVERIQQLVEATAKTNLTILAGSGLTKRNIKDFVEHTGVREVHVGSGARQCEQVLELVDAQRVREICRLIG